MCNLQKPQTVKRQSGKSKFVKTMHKTHSIGGKRKFYTSSSFKNVTFFYYQLHINIHTLIKNMLQPMS